jgi:hypothetical protein
MALGFNVERLAKVFDELELVCTLGIAADHVGEAVEHLSVQLLAPLPAHLAYSTAIS